MLMTLGQLRTMIIEAVLPVRPPKTPEEKRALLDLVAWSASRMEVTDSEAKTAIGKAMKGDWADAFDLLSTFYFMKGIRPPKQK